MMDLKKTSCPSSFALIFNVKMKVGSQPHTSKLMTKCIISLLNSLRWVKKKFRISSGKDGQLQQLPLINMIRVMIHAIQSPV